MESRAAMEHEFIPAMYFHPLTRFLDAALRLMGLGEGFRFAIAAHLGAQPGECIVDIGAGTGTLALVVKGLVPEATVVGVDADARALAIALHKAARAGVEIDFRQARAEQLPLADASCDRAVSSLVFHHLPGEVRLAAAREALRVLKPGGRMLLVDFGPLRGALAPFNRVAAALRLEHSRDNFLGRLPPLLEEAGFENVRTVRVVQAMVHFVEATKPAVPRP